MFLTVVFFFLCAAISYLLGSISFAVILSKLFSKKDIRELGSGNAGMTNVLRNFGPLPGILTFVGDCLKAVLSVGIGMYLITPWMNGVCKADVDKIYIGYLCAFFCIIGHSYPIFFQFRGGKGIVVAIGSIALLDWRAAVILIAVFGIVVVFSKIVSLGSVISSAAFPIVNLILGVADKNDGKMIIFKFVGALLMGGLTIYMHRANIMRLKNGEEKKLTVKKTEKR